MNAFRELYLAELTKKQKKIDKNHNGKVDGQDLQILRKEDKEDQTKNAPDNAKPTGKGGKVETKKYSWGTMKTVHHGSDFSIPLHPEHHQAIHKLKDQQEHKFKDETGRHWTAKKSGEHVHFQGANNGGKTHVPAHTMAESYDDNRRGFGRRPREDDEYHVPDPTVKKVKVKTYGVKKEETLLDRIAEAAKKRATCSECGEVKCGCPSPVKEDKQSDLDVVNKNKVKNKKMQGPISPIKEEELHEANHREYASQGKMHPDMAKHMSVGQEHDYYEHGTGDKVSGKVMHKSATEVHMKQTHDSYDPKKKGTVHKFKISDKLDEEVIAEEEGYTIHSKHTEADGTTTITLKSPNGKLITHKGKGSHKMVKQKYGIHAEEKELTLDQRADLFADRAGMDPHYKEIRRRQFMAMFGKDATTDVDKKTGIVSKNKMDPLQPMVKKEELNMNSFKSYMQEDLDEAAWPGTPEYKAKFGDAPTRGKVGSTSKGAKGTSTVTSTGVKHERDYEKAEKEGSAPESQEKRGRGRPKGAASGARQKGSAAKSDDRYDSTGYKLHLPNKNR